MRRGLPYLRWWSLVVHLVRKRYVPALAGICFSTRSLAQDCAVLGIKNRQLKKAQAARRILQVLSQARHYRLFKGLLAWVVWVTNDIQAKKVCWLYCVGCLIGIQMLEATQAPSCTFFVFQSILCGKFNLVVC